MANMNIKDPDSWNVFDRLTFSWMNKVVRYARKGVVTVDELPLPTDKSANVCCDEFTKNWDDAVHSSKNSGKGPSLMKVLWKTYGKDVVKAGIFKALWSVFVILGAFYFTRSILLFVRTAEGKEQSIYDADWKGWVLTIFFFIDAWLLGICLQRMGFGCLNVGIRARAALISIVTKRCYNMASLSKELAATAVSFVASDINKVFEGMQEIHYLWTAPFEALAIIILLATLVGIYCLPGAAILMFIVPCQYFFGFKIIQNKVRNGPNIRARNGIIQELLPAMKLVKYYAWEQFFEEEVTAVRKREMWFMFKNAVIKTVNVSMVFGVPPVVATAVMGSYEFGNDEYNAAGEPVPYLKPQNAFTMLSLFNIMRFPLVVLPKAIRAMTEALASISALEAFLQEPVVPKQNTEGSPGVHMKRAVFQHPGNSTFKLCIPEFHVSPGELVAVVGRVGAGKSSLIQAIMGNMEKIEGEAEAGGQISYVPQNPWCQNLSLRDNILFGKEMQSDFYRQVIHACALEFDLSILPQGDDSFAGLRGINLSGGQRQRLNLARCAYYNGDLILLDNALSAVDHHTAQHIFEHCVRGIFGTRATILITHQVEFLPQCDKVAIMNEGECLYFGPWNEQAQELLGRYLPISHMLAAAGGAEQPRDPPKKKEAKKEEKKEEKKDEVKAKAAATTVSMSRAMWEYCCAAGWVVFMFSLFFFLISQISRQIADYWVRWWNANKFDAYATPCGYAFCGDAFYVGVYGFLTLAFLVFMLFRGAYLYWWCLGASQRLHKRSVHCVLYAPLGFFFKIPVGDLLVSFTKEQDIMDEALPDSLYYAGIYGLILLATTITVSITIPMFAALTGGLYLMSAVMLFLYLPAAMHLKKLRQDSAAALVTLIAESLDGLQVIQAFNRQGYFDQVTSMKTDRAHKALLNAETLNLWLAFYCDFYGAGLILAVACFAVSQKTELGSSAVGLAFSQSIQMLVFYTWSVRLLADSIGLFGSVEKIAFLANHVETEGDAVKSAGNDGGKGNKNMQIVTVDKPGVDSVVSGKKWPATGNISFEDVWMKYNPTAPFALKGVTFKVTSAEKVGVVGRTGSGKSTLLLALYRMFNLEKGRIVVDNVDIATITLKQLRWGLSVIPQEPVVFSGTVRTNLDPFKQFTDAELWEVIKEVGLDYQVQSIGGLDGKVDGTGGQSWSLGQQQLVCLARAALKKVPILCLDEATAAMDPHTEQLVLEIIDRMFADRTTFTIAHRLDTVIKSDKVVVMDAGVLMEMDSPSALLDDRGSMFSALVDKTGAAAAAALRQVAAEYLASKTGTK